jgi:aminobenzoyl-glutamate utilization protein B
MSTENTLKQWAEIDEIAPNIIENSDKVWEYAELGLEEDRSSKVLCDWVESEGFEVVERQIAGMDTAWKATFGSGSPVIGIVAEFDALPGLGNEPVDCKTPRKDGTTSGHGCGHNLIGAGAIGAAIALKKRMEKNNLSGTLEVFGCPAEELLTGKNYMAKAGAFDNLDACLHWHPLWMNNTWNLGTTACADISFDWKGQTAHSGATPWDGRSALHACEMFANGINAMREHIVPDARMHYIIERGGDAVNVVPEFGKVAYRYRGPSAENVRANAEWARDIARGAALMTQTELTITDLAGCYECLKNQTMSDRMHSLLGAYGCPVFTEEEHEFAKSIQRECDLPEEGMSTVLSPDMNGVMMGGSTDVGDITYIVPTMGVTTASWPLGIPPHHWGCTATNGMSIGHKAAVKAAQVLAAFGEELLTDKQFLDDAKAEFQELTGGKPYEALVSADTPPLLAGARSRVKNRCIF